MCNYLFVQLLSALMIVFVVFHTQEKSQSGQTMQHQHSSLPLLFNFHLSGIVNADTDR